MKRSVKLYPRNLVYQTIVPSAFRICFLALLLLSGCGLEWDDIYFERRENIDPNDFQATRIAEAQAPTSTYEADIATQTAEAFVVILTPTSTPPPPPEVVETLTSIYADTPSEGWTVKAELATVGFADRPAIGDASIEVQIDDVQGNFSLESGETVFAESDFDEIRFEINGDVGGQLITFNLVLEDGTISAPYVLEPLKTQWDEIRVPLSAFKAETENRFVGFMWRDAQGGVAAPFYVDNISLVQIQ
ncbi:MAG: hypothetical protein AAF633_13380 [Chloroflexota bacterium]